MTKPATKMGILRNTALPPSKLILFTGRTRGLEIQGLAKKKKMINIRGDGCVNELDGGIPSKCIYLKSPQCTH